ncbi:MAG TPA: phosphoenolpyruvate--protein phosphotransferase [Desulfobacteraceae bacterium]|nr:phosphoenolpyruvate--protein phosphotransferase [Desulfobacteraceae bacterium]
MNTREPDHLNLLCDLTELTAIITADADIETFLAGATGLVAKHLKAHVCSIYLFDGNTHDLILTATRGLNPDAVNQVRMKPDEGLVGQCYSTGRILREGNAQANPGFKYFAAAGEEPFNSFLCVPIRRGVEKVGVLVVQHREIDHFTFFDERALKTAATQLGGAIENARLIMALPGETHEQKEIDPGFPPFVRGKSDRAGVAFGMIRPSRKNRKAVIHTPDTSGKTYTLEDFKTALEKTTKELKELQEKFAASLPESASLIFTAHFMMLRDKKFTGKMEEKIREGRPPVEVVQELATKYISFFSESPHAYLREKAVDVEDLSIRLLSNLKAARRTETAARGSIVVAEDLYPSDILKLTADGIRGIILAGGGATSHVTILSRSLDIPLIIADDPVLLQLPETTRLLMDTGQGNIYINPDQKTLDLFTAKTEAETQTEIRTVLDKTLTRDGSRIRLLANINLLSEIRLAKELKAEGVGLYRTEFPFLIRPSFPSEDEQYLIYKKLFDQTEGGQVTTVRTLDVGGEKALSYAGSTKEANPVLGLRSIRFALKYREVFDTQVRAILRAAYGKKNVRLMFPLISSIDEFLEAKKVVADCANALQTEGIHHESDIDIGMMIELPSVLTTINEFAKLADFFAIGTNDFIQYMVGADRANKLVADHYLAHHPAVTRGIKTIADAARKARIDVSVCGEMAHDPIHIPFLIGAGITTLSVDPKFIPDVQQTIMDIRMADARIYADNLLAQSRISDAAKVLASSPGKKR